MVLNIRFEDSEVEKIVNAIYAKEEARFTSLENQMQEIKEKIEHIKCTESTTPEDPKDPQTEIVEDKSIIASPSKYAGLKTASEIVGKMVAGWNLAGTLEAVGGGNSLSQETSWGEPKATQELFDTVAKKGFNAVRLPITWSQHVDWSDENRTIDAAWMNRVKEVVGYALKNDLFAIINTHHDHSSYMHANSNFKQWLTLETSQKDSTITNFKKIWTQIADAFKEFDGRVIFEGWNEIQHNKQDWVAASDAEWEILNTLSQTFVDVVRATGGNNTYRCLLINPPMTSSKNMLEKMIFPKDVIKDHIFVSGHPYDARMDVTELEDIFPDWDKMIEKGIPVIFGEIGTDASMKEAERVMNAHNYAAVGRQHKIPLFWWDDTTRQLLNRTKYLWDAEKTVDAFIEGAASGEVQEKVYTAVYDLNDLNNWKTGCLNERTGVIEAGKNNNKVLVSPIRVSEGHKYNLLSKSHDNGFQINNYVFYDKDGNYVYGIHKASMYTPSVVCPKNAVSMNFTLWNPWGYRSNEQLTNYFNKANNEYLVVSVKEEETTEAFIDERMLAFSDLDLSLYSNWRKGEYQNYGGGYNSGNGARLCVKGLLPVNSNSYYELKIEPGNGSVDISKLALSVCTYDKNLDFIQPLYRSYVPCAVYSGSAKNIGLTMFYRNNLTGATPEDFKAAFDSGIKVSCIEIPGLSTLTKTSADFAKAKQLSTKTGKMVDSGESYRCTGFFDVTKAGRTIVFYAGDDRLFVYAEYDKKLGLINCQTTDRNNVFHLSQNAAYFRVSVHNVDSGTTYRIGYSGVIGEAEFDEESIKIVDKSELKAVIDNAISLLDVTKRSVDGKEVSAEYTWVDEVSYNALSNALQTANEVYLSSVDETELKNTKNTLEEETKAFLNKVQRGLNDNTSYEYFKTDLVFDGANYVDTGVKLFAQDQDWTIELVYENKDIYSLGKYNHWDKTPVLLFAADKYSLKEPVKGFYKDYFSGGQQGIYATKRSQYFYAQSPISASYTGLVEIYTHKAGENTFKVIRRSSKTAINGSISSFEVDCTPFEGTVLLGGEPNKEFATTMPKEVGIKLAGIKKEYYEDEILKERYALLWNQFGCEA